MFMELASLYKLCLVPKRGFSDSERMGLGFPVLVLIPWRPFFKGGKFLGAFQRPAYHEGFLISFHKRGLLLSSRSITTGVSSSKERESILSPRCAYRVPQTSILCTYREECRARSPRAPCNFYSILGSSCAHGEKSKEEGGRPTTAFTSGGQKSGGFWKKRFLCYVAFSGGFR